MLDFEQYLRQTLQDLPNSNVKDAMEYSLMAGGKRIRPKLLFAALNAYQVCEEKGLGAGAAIEMIHTYSLIHDDLPAMDNDTLRRGKPTCHVKYGEGVAILAGDALLTNAFKEALKSCEDSTMSSLMIDYLSDYSGANGMVYGQILDLEGEANPNITVEELEKIHFYKTGKLITLPLICAAIIAHRKEDIEIWKEVGHYIGLSFQIQDDVLDVTSSVEVLGKNVNSDESNQKSTYVTLMGIDAAKEKAQFYYQKAWEWLRRLSIDTEAMEAVFDELTKRKY